MTLNEFLEECGNAPETGSYEIVVERGSIHTEYTSDRLSVEDFTVDHHYHQIVLHLGAVLDGWKGGP